MINDKKDSLKTMSDMMQILQAEIAAIKSGELEESKGRLVLRARGLQLKGAGLQLQYERLHKGRVPDPELRLIQPGHDKDGSET